MTRNKKREKNESKKEIKKQLHGDSNVAMDTADT